MSVNEAAAVIAAAVLRALLSCTRGSGKSVGHIGTRVKVLVSMDPGQDLDDEMFLILLSARPMWNLVAQNSASWPKK
jgi:hypothetical protein